MGEPCHQLQACSTLTRVRSLSLLGVARVFPPGLCEQLLFVQSCHPTSWWQQRSTSHLAVAGLDDWLRRRGWHTTSPLLTMSSTYSDLGEGSWARTEPAALLRR